MKSIILSSLKQSFQIKDKKLLFFLLFLIQTGFIVLISYLFVHYYNLIMTSLNAVINTLAETPIGTDFTPQQSLLLYTHFRAALRKIKTIAGRQTRDIERQFNSQQKSKYKELFVVINRILIQKRGDKNKIYRFQDAFAH